MLKRWAFSVAIQFHMKALFKKILVDSVLIFVLLCFFFWYYMNKKWSLQYCPETKKMLTPLRAIGLNCLRHIVLQMLHPKLHVSFVEFTGKHLCLSELPTSIFRVEIIHRLSLNDIRQGLGHIGSIFGFDIFPW